MAKFYLGIEYFENNKIIGDMAYDFGDKGEIYVKSTKEIIDNLKCLIEEDMELAQEVGLIIYSADIKVKEGYKQVKRYISKDILKALKIDLNAVISAYNDNIPFVL